MMTKNKTTAAAAAAAAAAFKRSRRSPTVTPLTRQVMTKSFHRAILEYQHTQSMCAVSPKSPLDLRVRAAIYRGRNGTPVKCFMKTEQHRDKSLKTDSNGHTSASLSSSTMSTTTTTTKVTTTVMNTTQDHSSRLPNTLETVYEQEKDANSETLEHIESNGENDGVLNGPLNCDSIAETPILLAHRKSIDTTDGSENFDNEIWYTPKETIQTDLMENIEVI